MKVAIGADHRGWQLKEEIKSRGIGSVDTSLIEWVDIGAFQNEPEDDYPDIAKILVEKIKSDPEVSKGVLICGSGVGMCIAANKYPKVRCGLALNPTQVKAAREEDNINVLALAADYTPADAAVVLIEVFLKTEFSRLPRYTQRIEKIEKINA